MLELAIIVFLILLNGLFALSELAVISSRPARIKAMIESGKHGSLRALGLPPTQGVFFRLYKLALR